MTPVVEEFYNMFHSSKDGKFTSGGAASGRAGFREGSHSPAVAAARNSVGARGSGGRVATTNFPKKGLDPVGRALWTYGPGRKTTFGGRKPQIQAEPRNFPRGDGRKGPSHSVATNKALAKTGHAVLGKPVPLRNPTTGRLNPSAVRLAFKQNNAQSGGAKSAGSKRTEHIGGTPVTYKTVKGRKISHVSTGGRATGVSKLRNSFYNQLQTKSGHSAFHTTPPAKQNTPFADMKNREARQQKLAQTNRARANNGMPPLTV